jgi:hypothetical protein
MCASCPSWYGRHVAPYVVHAGCSADAFTRMRRRMVPLAQGVVVEVGFGSGQPAVLRSCQGDAAHRG